MAENWAQKYEKTKDLEYENTQRNRIEAYTSLLEKSSNNIEKMKCLRGILDAYENLKYQSSQFYDDEDYFNKKEELQQLWKKMQEEKEQSKDSISWTEYMLEEQKKSSYQGDDEVDGEER